MTCEHGNTVFVGEMFPGGQTPYCFLCWRAEHPAGPVSAGGTGVGACLWRSEPALANVIAARGFNPTKEHYYCGHPTRPLGMVTGCSTCGDSFKKAPLCGATCGGFHADLD